MQRFSYLFDIERLQLDESTGTSWINAMNVGVYDHPTYGQIKFTPERLRQFAANVNSNVRGSQLDIDYDHKQHSGEAAGWVKQAEVRDNSLWLLVEWTQRAAEKIKEKAYKYFSPEFIDSWKHPISGKTYDDVLLGGGITNRPFLKDLVPVNLSEMGIQAQETGSSGMDEIVKQLAALLGLPEDATAEQVLGAAQVTLAQNAPPAPPEAPSDSTDSGSDSDEDEEEDMNESSEDASDQVAIAASETAEVRKLNEKVAALEATIKLQEVNERVTSLSEKGDHRLPAAAADELKQILLHAPEKTSKAVFELFEKLSKTGLVSTAEIGASGDLVEDDAIKRFNEAVNKVVKEDNLTFAQAVNVVAANDPKLFQEYREASYAFKES